jgi:hypothetical protein
MIEGHPFIYQALDRTIYRVNEEGVQAIPCWSSNEPTVAFVDGDEKDSRPAPSLCNNKVQIIIAVSPKGASQKWLQQDSSVVIIATKLWSSDELFLAGFALRLFLSTFD